MYGNAAILHNKSSKLVTVAQSPSCPDPLAIRSRTESAILPAASRLLFAPQLIHSLHKGVNVNVDVLIGVDGATIFESTPD